MPDSQVVLVTGASSGFGRQTAVLLAKNGFKVYGTSRNPKPPPEFQMVPLDVNSDDSCRACVDQILATEGRIDVLVNNAGYLLSGMIEDVSIEEAKGVFETNLFGVHRMVRAVLPAMRKARRGKIINIGSLGGLVAAPGHGFYYATKFAIDGYSESLAHEVRSLGIHVSIVEPGYYKTNLHAAMVRARQSLSDYEPFRTRLFDALEHGVHTGGDPAQVARLVLRIIRTDSPRLRYLIGPGAHWIPFLKFILPQKFFAWGVRKFFRLD